MNFPLWKVVFLLQYIFHLYSQTSLFSSPAKTTSMQIHDGVKTFGWSLICFLFCVLWITNKDSFLSHRHRPCVPDSHQPLSLLCVRQKRRHEVLHSIWSVIRRQLHFFEVGLMCQHPEGPSDRTVCHWALFSAAGLKAATVSSSLPSASGVPNDENNHFSLFTNMFYICTLFLDYTDVLARKMICRGGFLFLVSLTVTKQGHIKKKDLCIRREDKSETSLYKDTPVQCMII